ncbi:pyridoxamine 5'-phosphate oxidase [Janibacter sp. GXQ6167]|uniref:pyridoxamine 5'-phosphate oxidase n=1 Tax=Janibacter sp. GXQ6167 TaxID=3240791 RepID=UPI0035231778
MPDTRMEYDGEGLTEETVAATPFAQIVSWIDEARLRQRTRGDVPEPLAMVVATVDQQGAPNARTVLMRFFDERGPGFVTNLNSTKSEELRANPRCAAVLTWPAIFKGIRFRGTATEIARDEVARYFAERPYGSQLSAWASAQSEPCEGREALERSYADAQARWPDGDVPVPDFWGGWRMDCDEVEFWAGRTNRLHDRLRFTRVGEGGLADADAWTVQRYQP